MVNGSLKDKYKVKTIEKCFANGHYSAPHTTIPKHSPHNIFNSVLRWSVWESSIVNWNHALPFLLGKSISFHFLFSPMDCTRNRMRLSERARAVVCASNEMCDKTVMITAGAAATVTATAKYFYESESPSSWMAQWCILHAVTYVLIEFHIKFEQVECENTNGDHRIYIWQISA